MEADIYSERGTIPHSCCKLAPKLGEGEQGALGWFGLGQNHIQVAAIMPRYYDCCKLPCLVQFSSPLLIFASHPRLYTQDVFSQAGPEMDVIRAFHTSTGAIQRWQEMPWKMHVARHMGYMKV
jgi:hypothetical protein